ncbi:MAG TPA: hypothetical protein VMU07_01535 [Candidatus Paceibacterota bacterium]|nr:hypothetical protein [Candidatus Paceibacterota bacterium]
MKKQAGQFIFFLVVLAVISLPHIGIAANFSTPNLWPTGFWGPLVSCTGNYLNGGSGTQCTSLCDLIDTFINVIYFGISVCLFILAPIMFAAGGIMMMLSGAQPEILSQGKRILTATVLGIAMVLLAYLVVQGFVSFLNISGVGGFSNGGQFNCVAS